MLPACPRLARIAPLAYLACACSGPELFIENDALAFDANEDRNYTSGLRYQNTITRDDAPGWVRGLANTLRPFKDEDPTEIGFFAGHHIYTPDDLAKSELIVEDRPYAGWAYVGLARMDADWEADRDASDDLTTMELTVGVIGPEAGGEEVQSAVHELIGSDDPKGWGNQLETEPTLMLSWMRQSRLWNAELGPVMFDVITHGGARLGTPYTDAEVGGLFRVGRLPKDFGVMPNEPSVVNPAPTRRKQRPTGLYWFVGSAGRAVAHNTFLDGNNFQDSHSVDREPLVGDVLTGIALHRGRLRMTYSLVLRTAEFDGAEDHVFGSLSLSWTKRE